MNCKMLEELSIGGNYGDQNNYESDFKSTKRGSNATDQKEKNLLLRPQKTKEVYQTPSMRIDSREKEPNKERSLSSGKTNKENKKTTRK